MAANQSTRHSGLRRGVLELGLVSTSGPAYGVRSEGVSSLGSRTCRNVAVGVPTGKRATRGVARHHRQSFEHGRTAKTTNGSDNGSVCERRFSHAERQVRTLLRTNEVGRARSTAHVHAARRERGCVTGIGESVSVAIAFATVATFRQHNVRQHGIVASGREDSRVADSPR